MFTASVESALLKQPPGASFFARRAANAVAGLTHYRENAAQWINRLSHWDLSEDAANSYMLQAYEKGIVGPRLLPLVIKEYRNPQHEEYRPRNAWSLFNAFTSALRTKQEEQPAQAALTTIRLQRLLSEGDVIDGTFSEPEQRLQRIREGEGIPADSLD